MNTVELLQVSLGNAFDILGQASALDAKTGALAYLAVLSALNCPSGIPFHTEAAKKAGASRDTNHDSTEKRSDGYCMLCARASRAHNIQYPLHPFFKAINHR